MKYETMKIILINEDYSEVYLRQLIDQLGYIEYKGEIFNYLNDIIYLMDNNLHIKALFENSKNILKNQSTFDRYVKLYKEKFGKEFEVKPYIKRIKE